MSYHFSSSLYRITKTVRIQLCHSWVSKKSLSYLLAVFLENHWNWPVCVLLKGGGAAIVHQTRLLSHVGGEGRVRVPTSDPHTINACWFLFLLFAYLLVAEAASFDKKELCRSDTEVIVPIFSIYLTFCFYSFDLHFGECWSAPYWNFISDNQGFGSALI